MKSLHQRMTWEEFEALAWRFGWKHEYWNGKAHITPRPHGVLVKAPVTPRGVMPGAHLAPLSAVRESSLKSAFYDAFADTVEYCDHTKKQVRDAAAKNMALFFKSQRGEPQLQLSRVALRPEARPRLAGAALITKRAYGFRLEILFIRPAWQRQGLATALLSAVMNDLRQAGAETLWSEYSVCNEQSAAWHRKFGFVEEPDLWLAQMRRNFCWCEVERHTRLGHIEQAAAARQALAVADAEWERLNEIERTQGYAAANVAAWKYG